MDFTREPIIETVITPKEGCKLVVRSSKSTAQEEYFVDSLEVVAFSNALFFRSLERPKAFLVPVTDYEVLEVREARLVLKNVGVERTIKIGGGKAQKETIQEKPEPIVPSEPVSVSPGDTPELSADGKTDLRSDKKRDKRRHGRRRRGKDEGPEEGEGAEGMEGAVESQKTESTGAAPTITTPPPIPVILPPPSMLISETIARYKDNALFKGAFYVKEEVQPQTTESESKSEAPEPTSEHPEDILEVLAMQDVSLEPSEFGSLGVMEEEQTIDWEVDIEKLDADEESDAVSKREPNE